MKAPSSLTDAELAMEMKQLRTSGENPARLEKLENEALGRVYNRR